MATLRITTSSVESASINTIFASSHSRCSIRLYYLALIPSYKYLFIHIHRGCCPYISDDPLVILVSHAEYYLLKGYWAKVSEGNRPKEEDHPKNISRNNKRVRFKCICYYYLHISLLFFKTLE
jgi:hypothetical protein